MNSKLTTNPTVLVAMKPRENMQMVVIELVEMHSPTIESYTRPLYEEELEEFGQINFRDFKFVAGIYLYSQKDLYSTETPL